mmetsp:Transcript_24632/g.49947  ORF Transcript_24632/g.49947 Transcript_24632/m.49947 type:complete len:209 (-) Transcript_24632:1892-2518(-)
MSWPLTDDTSMCVERLRMMRGRAASVHTVRGSVERGCRGGRRPRPPTRIVCCGKSCGWMRGFAWMLGDMEVRCGTATIKIFGSAVNVGVPESGMEKTQGTTSHCCTSIGTRRSHLQKNTSLRLRLPLRRFMEVVMAEWWTRREQREIADLTWPPRPDTGSAGTRGEGVGFESHDSLRTATWREPGGGYCGTGLGYTSTETRTTVRDGS